MVPTAVSPPVIIKIAVETVLNVVVYFNCSIVAEIIDVILVVVPLRAVKSVAHVSALPEIVNIAPVFAPIRTEVGNLSFIVARPFIPILLAIGDGLISLG
jgi:hypothetical protein